MKQPLPAFVFIFVAAGATAPFDKAASYTREQEQAWCQNDAMRLCNTEIPDEARVAACLKANRDALSPDCKKVFRSGSKHNRT